jgi:N6-L-threonylcarbamoyladenine synthase
MAGAELRIISADTGFCKAISPVFGGKRYDAPPMLVLGLETSCDETGVALFDTERGLIGQALHSQVDLHAVYGGVVPEIASRDHIRRLAVAYTAGPGLVGALMVGGGLASGLGLAWNCPVIPIHHMEGHLLAPMLEEDPPAYPFLALLVSGGHTMLVSVEALGAYSVLGSTLDDAVGEAFDKTAKLLGLPYPGGPALAALATKGNDEAFELPRPMLNREGFDFSFSGLKTAVMLLVRKAEADGSLDAVRADIAASFERAVVDTLVGRTLKAARSEQAERIVVAGGVGANTLLRDNLTEKFDGTVFYPRPEYCTDNGAMIACAGAMRLADGQEPATIQAMARWSLDSLVPPRSERI